MKSINTDKYPKFVTIEQYQDGFKNMENQDIGEEAQTMYLDTNIIHGRKTTTIIVEDLIQSS